MRKRKGTGRSVTRRTSLVVSAAALFAMGGIRTKALASTEMVRFVVPPWPGAEVKAVIVSDILRALGYTTKLATISAPMGIKAIAMGDADVVLSVWVPSEKPTLDAAMKGGQVVIVGTNLRDALYGVVVPDYVWRAGVHSLADLHEYPAKFGRTIYGIDAGSDGNLIMQNAIKRDTYDLKGWRLLPSSTAAMLAEARMRIERHEWVAFLGWKPHWMNKVFHLKYLEDPKGIWGHNYVVYTIANKRFVDAHPNVRRFLSQFSADAKIQSDWIYQYSFKHVSKEVVARRWISGHKAIVDAWLKGVIGTRGAAGTAALARSFQG